ncbi:MAG: tetratricopeptide repeat protein [Acidobacteriota bacterium]
MITGPCRSPLLLWTALLTLLAVPLSGRGGVAESRHDIRGIEALARAYDFILEARFDQVDAELRRACGPAPQEACDVLAATALWWRIQLDPESRELDDDFSTAVDHAIETTEAWTEREPDDAEAWFYLGGAYAARVQWRVLREERLAAARDGKNIRVALEHALALDPTLDDAYFGIGMYKYYADVAPAAAKLLRFVLMLPGGDRKEGLEQMLRARNRGRLLQGEADYQLHLIYLWYERQTPRALQLLQSLRERYPANPIFIAQTAEIQDRYQHDIIASLGTWRALLAAAREQRANAPVLSEVQARLGIARQLEALWQTDDAIAMLEAVVSLRPTAPFGAQALAQLRLGEAYDRMGRRADAVEAYRAAIVATPAPDSNNVRTQAGERLRRAPDPKHARAYRRSLEGWRSLEQNDLPASEVALRESILLNGADPVAHYRYGRVLQARKDDAGAVGQFEHAIRGAKGCPAPILGTAYLEAARIYERLGRRQQALDYYRTIESLFGAGADARAAARRALARLQR